MSLLVSNTHGLTFLDTTDLTKTIVELPGVCCDTVVSTPDKGNLIGLCDGGLKQLVGQSIVDLGKASPSGQTAAITAVVARQKGEEILFAQGNKVYSYDMRANRMTSMVLEGHKPSVQITKLAVNIADSHVASLTPTTILIHSLSSPHTRVSIKAPSDAPFTCLAFSRYRKTTLVTGYANGLVSVWDISKPTAPLRQKQAVKGEVVDIAYSPYSKRLCAVAGKDGDAALVDLEEDADKPFHKTIPGSEPLTCISFLPGGVSLVAGTSNGHVLLYNLRALSKPPVDIPVSTAGGTVHAVLVTKKLEQTSAALEAPPEHTESKSVPPKTTPLAEHSPNLPISASRHTVRQSISATSPPHQKASRASVNPASSVRQPEKRGRSASNPSISPRRSSLRTSAAPAASGTASVRSTSSRALPSSPQLPSISGSPPMPTKPVAKSVRTTTRESMVAGSSRPSVSKVRRESSPPASSRNTTGKSAPVPATTVTPPRSPPRAASPEGRTSGHHQPAPATSTALIPSPMKRNSTGPGTVQLEQMLGGPQPAEMLRAAFASALSDWRAESSRATRNLHMEVIRSARLQKNDFRRMMEEYMDEVHRLREENEMLRKENERLRRGY